MASYTGGSKAASRIQALQAQRKTQQEQLNQRKQQIVTASSKTVSNSFQSRSSTHQDLLHTDTVGLVTHTDFKARRKLMHSADAAPSEQPPTSSPVKPSKRPPFKRAVLSFAGESDDSDDSDDSDGTHSNDNAIHRQRNVNVCPPKKRRRLGKDPDVDSSFLPDRDRELAEDKERERLKQDWLRKQDAIKNETVRITYSFWDGTGHRKLISCKKGTTIAHFLTIVQTQVKQLRNTTADSLMFIKEDLIIPHHYSFYDFIVSKARGKSGPLFNFDVVEDVRLLADASKEKEDAHAAKVVERRWYERNRHIFPASRWEVYDPTKKFDKYTIHGH